MTLSKNNNIIICPECEALLRFTGKPHAGQRFKCKRCNNTLVITQTNPLYIDVAGRKVVEHRQTGKSGKKKTHIPSNNLPAQAPESNQKQGTQTNSNSAACPECGDAIHLKVTPKLRQAIVCTNCDEVLQVVTLRPLQLAIVDEEYWE